MDEQPLSTYEEISYTLYQEQPSALVARRQERGGSLPRGRAVAEGLRVLSATHGIKVRLARRLRRRTTMEFKWIAAELGVGGHWKFKKNHERVTYVVDKKQGWWLKEY